MRSRPPGCVAIEVHLVATATGEVDGGKEGRVREHVAACGPCRHDFEQYRAIEETVAALRARPAPQAAARVARDRLADRLGDLRNRLVAYRIFASPFGNLLIARSEQGVVLIEYLDGASGLGASRLRRAYGVEAVEDGREVERLYDELREYLDGRRDRLGWPLDLRLAGSAFHRAVLQATASIPYGAVVSYKRVARDVGRPEAVRAVAQALRWNPLPIVIPCHRVVGSSGALTGYAGSGETSRKQRLLRVEGVPVVWAHHDFEVPRDAVYVLVRGDTEYCLPTCPSEETLRANPPTLFGSRERAEAVGLLPCTTCRPDLHPIVTAVS